MYRGPNYNRSITGRGSGAGGILSGMTPIRNRFTDRAAQSQQTTDTYQPQTFDALDHLKQILSASTSDQERAGRVAARTANVNRNYVAGRSQVGADAALTGVDSGFNAGMVDHLNSSRFGTISNAENAAYDEDLVRKRTDADALFRTLYGVTSDASQQEGQNLGEATNIDQFQYQAQAQLEAEERARKEARRNGFIRALGGVAGIAAQFIPGFGGATKAARRSGGGWTDPGE